MQAWVASTSASHRNRPLTDRSPDATARVRPGTADGLQGDHVPPSPQSYRRTFRGRLATA